MSRVFRRGLSTSLTAPQKKGGPSTLPTVPLAVRTRRELYPQLQQPSPLTQPEKFVGEKAEPFPVHWEEEYKALRAKGALGGSDDAARRRFLAKAAEWRSRVRGGVGRVEIETGKAKPLDKLSFIAGRNVSDFKKSEYRDAVVGQKIFLPNIQIRLMRNHTPPGEAYDPWVATFRIPPSMTKHDLRSYLSAVYGLEVTFIRTDQYIAPQARNRIGQIHVPKGSTKNYKRAVVGLTEPFHYPDDVEEMRAGQWGGREAGAQQAAQRELVVDSEYAVDQVKDFRDAIKMKMNKGWRWRSGTHDNAGNTIREIMRRRAEREAAVAGVASAMSTYRASDNQETPNIVFDDKAVPA